LASAPWVYMHAAFPATRPKTTQSSNELPPRRLFPWMPPAISPAAYRPGILPLLPTTSESAVTSRPPGNRPKFPYGKVPRAPKIVSVFAQPSATDLSKNTVKNSVPMHAMCLRGDRGHVRAEVSPEGPGPTSRKSRQCYRVTSHKWLGLADAKVCQRPYQ